MKSGRIRRSALVGCLAILIVAAGIALVLQRTGRLRDVVGVVMPSILRPIIGPAPPMPSAVVLDEVPGVKVEEVARDLDIPWTILFTPDDRMLVTERTGRIKVSRGGKLPKTYLDMSSVVPSEEGGLMGLALDPDFTQRRFLYLMYTTRDSSGATVNRVSRFTDTGETAKEEKVLIDGIPATPYHNGGVLAFGPDRMLYVGTGDSGNPNLAQDPVSPNGKVLRITTDGGVPEDNPFPGSPTYAYGFRNVTGLAWHPVTKELWAANHGPSSGPEAPRRYARDSVFVVKKGGNHGWPTTLGVTDDPKFVSPILHWIDAPVPPGGSLFYTGTLFPTFKNSYFLTSLLTAHIQRVESADGRKITAIERWWPGKYGRVRAIAEGPDGAIYFGTSSRDGRQPKYPGEGADLIFRILPSESAK